MTKIVWLDVRGTAEEMRPALIEEGIHQRVDAVVSDRAEELTALPPTVRKVFFPDAEPDLDTCGDVDVVLVDIGLHGAVEEWAARRPELTFGAFLEVTDADTLEAACRAARSGAWTVILFKDPTKIPLEIVLAAAANAPGGLITVAADVTEAEIIFGVLERGADGVMLRPERVGDITAAQAAADAVSPELTLVELEVTATRHVGMGERACVDTCTHFQKDEGILVGSYSKGMILCVSETHPLPYMPTRPFRVNAGAIHSYTLAGNGRTRYLSELGAGAQVLAVDTKGRTRTVTVGRVKIESRPLLSIDAVSADGVVVNLILQDDWHVRVLGPGGAVLNSTELKPGDRLLGFLPTEDRHVGYPINEFCLEK
ncbi:3-dehydroquinate synthase II [Micromonospora sp. NPDC023814]|uniref:3-dehydroquinate synthase II n=1 Tax=Micromonospora sp. NPDC023814 TaxID=3154596 RepID=UPI0033E0FD48